MLSIGDTLKFFFRRASGCKQASMVMPEVQECFSISKTEVGTEDWEERVCGVECCLYYWWELLVSRQIWTFITCGFLQVNPLQCSSGLLAYLSVLKPVSDLPSTLSWSIHTSTNYYATPLVTCRTLTVIRANGVDAACKCVTSVLPGTTLIHI